jgi:hypothetical protein
MRPQRPRPGPPRKDGILIQCEGSRTEPRYLDDFNRDCRANHRFNMQVKPGKGMNAVVTVEAAIREGQRTVLGEKVYDEVWCVLDVEHAAHEAKLNEAIALAKKHGIRLCLSNPSFEVWLLAHFERTTRSFENSSAVERRLEEDHWKKHFGCGYEKGDPRLYERLASHLPTAVENAEWVLETFHENKPCRESNASTEVYQLIRRLLPPAEAPI